MKVKQKRVYETETARTRKQRMRWWHDARYGLFVHWGLYSLIGRGEWVRATECIPDREYQKLADRFCPGPNPARAWAQLACESGMKYMVLTTKHHDGFCLWDTKQTSFNTTQTACGRDLVAEYVSVCREFGLRIGLYYSLMDWQHPDGARCAYDSAARERFLAFTRGCVRELMTHYGKIDILWYDMPLPFRSHEGWDSLALNQMVRSLQPEIIIKDGSGLCEDFSVKEEGFVSDTSGRGSEACLTFNGYSWGYMPSADIDGHTPRTILKMLNAVCAGPGNMMMNIGPAPDGSVTAATVASLKTVGKWLTKNGEAVFGKLDPTLTWDAGYCTCGALSRKGKRLYFWCHCWPGREFTLGGFKTKLKSAAFLSTGREIAFEQNGLQIHLKDLPSDSPDKLAGVTVLVLDFVDPPRHRARSTTPALTSWQ